MHKAPGLPEVSSVDTRLAAQFPQVAETKVSKRGVWRRKLGDRRKKKKKKPQKELHWTAGTLSEKVKEKKKKNPLKGKEYMFFL